MDPGWRVLLFRLHASGWNADDVDEACEGLYEACSEGAYEGTDVEDLSTHQVRAVLHVNVDERLAVAIRGVAALRAQQTSEAEALRNALYDLDAFAYGFDGND